MGSPIRDSKYYHSVIIIMNSGLTIKSEFIQERDQEITDFYLNHCLFEDEVLKIGISQ